jgi:hypothetical protein
VALSGAHRTRNFARLNFALTERGETAVPVSFSIFNITLLRLSFAIARQGGPGDDQWET